MGGAAGGSVRSASSDTLHTIYLPHRYPKQNSWASRLHAHTLRAQQRKEICLLIFNCWLVLCTSTAHFTSDKKNSVHCSRGESNRAYDLREPCSAKPPRRINYTPPHQHCEPLPPQNPDEHSFSFSLFLCSFLFSFLAR